MIKLPLRPRPVILALALSSSAAVVAGEARAGTLGVRDEAHVLSPGDVARLRSVLAAAPFDGRFLVTSAYPDAQDLSRVVGGLVNEPDMVVVGVDPVHRHVQVHFGTGSGVARSERVRIEQAGNDAFRRGDWEGGGAAIFEAASRAVSPRDVDTAPPAVAERPSLLGPGVLLLLVVGAVGVGLYFARRRAQEIASYGGGQGYGPGPGPGPWAGPGYPAPPPPQGGGVGPLGGGLIGAGVGGLAGYELGKLEGEREQRDEGRPLEQPQSDQGASYDDGGGGGSSWNDDGGGGGFDGGGDGGGSDF